MCPETDVILSCLIQRDHLYLFMLSISLEASEGPMHWTNFLSTDDEDESKVGSLSWLVN